MIDTRYPVQISEHSFDTGTLAISYGEGPPSGPPLVFLHGGSARWRAYEDVLLDLAGSVHLFAPDLRGHGHSGRAPGRYALPDYADDIVAFMRQVVAQPAALFGHSLGGNVALLVAARSAECTTAVVVGDSPLTQLTGGSGPHGASDETLAAWRDLAGGRLSVEEITEALKDAPARIPGQQKLVTMREKHGEDSAYFPAMAANLYYNDPDMLTAVLDGATSAGYDLEEVLRTIRSPVLLLQGDPDAGGLLTDAQMDRALGLLAQGRHARLLGTGHNIFWPDPARVLRIVLEFLESV
jgi:pimeloyl-ACP methyl ester carboxylesterase